MPFDEDRDWQAQFLPSLKRIAGEVLISEAPSEDDQERNTDLIVLRLEAIRIGCRVRSHPDDPSWYDEFTIRTSRPSGVNTEIHKVIQGWGDYFLYGFGDESTGEVDPWLVGDLTVFRLWHSQYLVKNGGRPPGELRANKDRSSLFRVYRVDELPDAFVVGRKRPQHSVEVF